MRCQTVKSGVVRGERRSSRHPVMSYIPAPNACIMGRMQKILTRGHGLS